MVFVEEFYGLCALATARTRTGHRIYTCTWVLINPPDSEMSGRGSEECFFFDLRYGHGRQILGLWGGLWPCGVPPRRKGSGDGESEGAARCESAGDQAYKAAGTADDTQL